MMGDLGIRALAPRTQSGEQFAALAEEHGAAAAARAAKHDEAGTFPIETFDEMRASGFLGALVPEKLGGLGVGSVHDWVVGMNRLGRPPLWRSGFSAVFGRGG